MIHFNGPTTVHTAIDGNAGEVRVTVTPDAGEIARLQARITELEAALAPLIENYGPPTISAVDHARAVLRKEAPNG